MYLTGKVNTPSSKSIGHRALICAALADGNSIIKISTYQRTLKLQQVFWNL